MSSSLVPSSSAAHGITYSQNVARDVAERIDELRAATERSRVMAWTFFVAPLAATAAMMAAVGWGMAFVGAYLCFFTIPIGAVVHGYRRRALRNAEVLDRQRDVAWVSPQDGLVFFSDDGVYVEKRGGFRPYAVQSRRFTHVDVSHRRLVLHGMDSGSGATYSLEVRVPVGWTDDDTRRVQQKLGQIHVGG